MTDAPTLGTPLRLPCGVTLPNRLLKSAMTEGLADAADRPTAAHVTLYRRWSEGGTGTLVTGNVMVDRRYLERPGNVVIESDDDLPLLLEWARAGTARGNQLWMQISHPGRQCTRLVASQPVAPSEVTRRLGGLFGKPRALTQVEIPEIIAKYARAAGIAKRAGFTGVQVHGAHGYLCNRPSPRTNLRTDEWGGLLENRARFLRAAVRRWPRSGSRIPVAVKLNSSDFQKGVLARRLVSGRCVAGGRRHPCSRSREAPTRAARLLGVTTTARPRGGEHERRERTSSTTPLPFETAARAAGRNRRVSHALERASQRRADVVGWRARYARSRIWPNG
jgi:2,4-dienoyl-CoA reductase-like NADH-dependent reductase (Old Yellow Enzyme family)